MRGEDRVAEVAAQQLADPGEELDQQRLVEPQLGADLRDILGGGEIAGDDRGRIAGRQMQQREDEHRDDHDHRHGRQQAADQEDMHGGSATATQRAGMVTSGTCVEVASVREKSISSAFSTDFDSTSRSLIQNHRSR